MVVDQWCYYNDGVEVYRDIDTNFNKKADQFRWLNTAGSRWGIDANEDEKIDSLAGHLGRGSDRRTGRRDSRSRSGPLRARAVDRQGAQARWAWARPRTNCWPRRSRLALANFATLVGQQKLIAPTPSGSRSAAAQPGIVPAGTEESTADLVVYENVAAMIETDGKPQAITVGTLVRTSTTAGD